MLKAVRDGTPEEEALELGIEEWVGVHQDTISRFPSFDKATLIP